MTVWQHDPDSVLDYTFDWSTWLSDGETISDATITPSTGLTIDSTNIGPTAVTVWVSTDGTIGPRQVACLIETSGGRTVERTGQINVLERLVGGGEGLTLRP